MEANMLAKRRYVYNWSLETRSPCFCCS